jgi:hypothetical protein
MTLVHYVPVLRATPLDGEQDIVVVECGPPRSLIFTKPRFAWERRYESATPLEEGSIIAAQRFGRCILFPKSRQLQFEPEPIKGLDCGSAVLLLLLS